MAGSRVLYSSHISRVSTFLLLVGGLVLLFAADEILPRLIPDFPANGAWLGQLLAAAWLGMASLNWLNRSLLLGGIYGRPVVTTNAVLYFISATVLVKVAGSSERPGTMWILTVPAMLFAGLYAWLLYRGPFEHDLDISRRAQPR